MIEGIQRGEGNGLELTKVLQTLTLLGRLDKKSSWL
jgi:hypothetical protein